MGVGQGSGRGAGRGPGLLAGTEVCASLLLLCWLCCWPDDSSEASSPSEYPRKPVLIESGSRRRSGELFGRRGVGSSAISLHLPGTSGYKQSLSAHRSHEEIRSRSKSHHDTSDTADNRYHSAPSVIDEVLHRRDWDRSTRELYIPLKPQNEITKSESSPSLEGAPYAEPESSSIECLRPDDQGLKTTKICKKHYTNIKSSKGKKCKESNKDDIKDTDATEAESSNFYIGDTHDNSSVLTRGAPSNAEQSPVYNRALDYEEFEEHEHKRWHQNLPLANRPSTSNFEEFGEHERLAEERNRSTHKGKEAKQSLNESIRLKELPRKGLAPLAEGEVRSFAFCVDEDIDDIDRSGAVHHTIESRMSLRQYPPPSVETVGYDGGACYLAEVGSVSELRARAAEGLSPHAPGAALAALAARAPPAGLRARHASDGDILAPPLRPESGAFSESDVDWELDSEERPPDYDEAQTCRSPDRRETAI